MHLSVQLASHEGPYRADPSLLPAELRPVSNPGMEIPDPSLEDRKRSLAQSEKIYRSVDHADTCVIY